MGKTFGIKEAKLAGQFAKSTEQKETVFAMLAMFGVKNVLKEQVAKIVTELTKKIYKDAGKVSILHDKVDVLEVGIAKSETKASEAEGIQHQWNI